MKEIGGLLFVIGLVVVVFLGGGETANLLNNIIASAIGLVMAIVGGKLMRAFR